MVVELKKTNAEIESALQEFGKKLKVDTHHQMAVVPSNRRAANASVQSRRAPMQLTTQQKRKIARLSDEVVQLTKQREQLQAPIVRLETSLSNVTTWQQLQVQRDQQIAAAKHRANFAALRTRSQATGKVINPVDGAELIFIPAGSFIMGDPRFQTQTVYLDGYWMYKTEVTVGQYRKFCEATGHRMPEAPEWDWKETHPIVNVSWDDAKAYCQWAGVDLPSSAQWQKAARGTDGRKYPWGNVWDVRKVRCSELRSGDGGSTAPVGSFPNGASPYGLLDMAGNVWEWTSTVYRADPGRRGPHSVKGGSWYNRDSGSFRVFEGLRPPLAYSPHFGFRGSAGR